MHKSKDQTELPKHFLTVDQWCHVHSTSHSACYKMLKEGTLGSVKVGRRRLIPQEATERWLASLEG